MPGVSEKRGSDLTGPTISPPRSLCVQGRVKQLFSTANQQDNDDSSTPQEVLLILHTLILMTFSANYHGYKPNSSSTPAVSYAFGSEL